MPVLADSSYCGTQHLKANLKEAVHWDLVEEGN